jgi:hypothetical protein
MTDDQGSAPHGRVAGWGYWLVTIPIVVLCVVLIIWALVKLF